VIELDRSYPLAAGQRTVPSPASTGQRDAELDMNDVSVAWRTRLRRRVGATTADRQLRLVRTLYLDSGHSGDGVEVGVNMQHGEAPCLCCCCDEKVDDGGPFVLTEVD
jgi:hypothetical protein